MFGVTDELCIKIDRQKAANRKLRKAIRELVNAWDERSSDCGETETSVAFREELQKLRKIVKK